jgi:hypothetical protein
MRAEKIAIAISKDPQGKYQIQVIGINGDRVVASLPDLETTGISFGAVLRRFELLWQTVQLRLSKKSIEFAVKGEDDDNDEVERHG